MLDRVGFIRDRLASVATVDVLSDVMTVARAGRPRSARVRWHAPWAQEFATVTGSAGFQVILSGSCWLLPPDGPPVRLSAGDVVFVPHGRGHTLADEPATRPARPACHPDNPGRAARHADDVAGSASTDAEPTVVLCGAYRMEATRRHPLLRELPDLIHLSTADGRHRRLAAGIDLLGTELAAQDPGIDTVVPALLEALLTFILRAWLDQRPGGRTGWAAALDDAAVTAALRAIHGEPATRWTVAGLADVAGMSRAPFAKRFAALVGQPPLHYLTWWRMTTAARLLETTDAPLRAVAGRVGYGSEFAFANAFKRWYGTAPGRHRRAHRRTGAGVRSRSGSGRGLWRRRPGRCDG